MDLSVVIPIYNEEGNLSLLNKRLTETLDREGISFEMILVNDGSRDDSLKSIRSLAAQDQRVKYIDFSRNFGHQIAVSAGLDHALGKAVVIIDADLQDPPEVIPQLYKQWKEGFQVVYARREKRQGERWFKRVTAKWFYRLLSWLTSVDIPLDTGDFRLIDRRIVEELRKMGEYDKFLRGQIAWIGFDQTDVTYERHERHSGESGYSIGKMFRFALDGITAFSDVPLKIVTWVGFFVSALAFLLILYTLFSFFILDSVVRGWSSLMISILFIGGIQLIALGIIGEYLSRMNHNVRNRPLYIIRDTNLQDSEAESSSSRN